MPFKATFIILLAYFIGAIPWAYIAARLLRGTDIRQRGSGNVGVTNLYHNVARWMVLPVGILDFLKGLAPVYLARTMGLSLEIQCIAGLMSVTGHVWSVYLKFSGGRGSITIIGMLAILAPREIILGGLMGSIGGLFWNAPISTALGLIAMPLMAIALSEPAPVILTLFGTLIVVMIKRLFPSRKSEGDGSRKSLIINRLFLDRDVREREKWIQRRK